MNRRACACVRVCTRRRRHALLVLDTIGMCISEGGRGVHKLAVWHEAHLTCASPAQVPATVRRALAIADWLAVWPAVAACCIFLATVLWPHGRLRQHPQQPQPTHTLHAAVVSPCATLLPAHGARPVLAQGGGRALQCFMLLTSSCRQISSTGVAAADHDRPCFCFCRCHCCCCCCSFGWWCSQCRCSRAFLGCCCCCCCCYWHGFVIGQWPAC